MIVEFMGMSAEKLIITVNGYEADLDNKVSENDVIELNEKIVHDPENTPKLEFEDKSEEADKPEKPEKEDKPKQDASYIFQNMNNGEENGGDKLLVIVNDKPVVMSGKPSYSFVDVFDYIDFDTSKMQGSGIATIVNGKDAQYTQPLHAGDKIEIYWKGQK
jgi:putative ubiquitin-RnfH superfamily antitoxin RatB of RatAB toxin-antitoxin module